MGWKDYPRRWDQDVLDWCLMPSDRAALRRTLSNVINGEVPPESISFPFKGKRLRVYVMEDHLRVAFEEGK